MVGIFPTANHYFNDLLLIFCLWMLTSSNYGWEYTWTFQYNKNLINLETGKKLWCMLKMTTWILFEINVWLCLYAKYKTIWYFNVSKFSLFFPTWIDFYDSKITAIYKRIQQSLPKYKVWSQIQLTAYYQITYTQREKFYLLHLVI